MYQNLYLEFMNELKNRKLTNQKSIFHYTSSEGLIGILKNKQIWFSNTKFLNDEQERKYTYNLIIDEINKIPNTKLNEAIKNYYDENSCMKNNVNTNILEYDYYVACFSGNKDSLSLWNYYTKSENSTGYNIEFDKSELLKTISLTGMDSHGQVIYDEKEQRELIRNILKKYNDAYINISNNDINTALNITNDLFLLINFYSLFFKHKAFKYEEEYRIAIGKNKINIDKFETKFRAYKDLFIPFTEKNFSSTCIKSITISPTQKKKITQDSVKKMLDEMEYEKIKVNVSDIPLRY